MATHPRRGGEETSRTTGAGAETGEQAMRAGAKTVQHGADTAREAWESGVETATRGAQRSMNQLSKAFGLTGEAAHESMQRSSATMQAILESTAVVTGGLQGLSGEWLRFVQTRAERNQEGAESLLGCRTAQEYVARQTDLVRENLESFLNYARRATEMATRIVEQASRKLGDSPEAPLAPR